MELLAIIPILVSQVSVLLPMQRVALPSVPPNPMELHVTIVTLVRLMFAKLVIVYLPQLFVQLRTNVTLPERAILSVECVRTLQKQLAPHVMMVSPVMATTVVTTVLVASAAFLRILLVVLPNLALKISQISSVWALLLEPALLHQFPLLLLANPNAALVPLELFQLPLV